MAKRKSPRNVNMKYTYRLIEQESDNANHIPDHSDLFVVENWGHLDEIHWSLERFIKKLPYPRSRHDSYLRSKKWLEKNHPEFLI